MNEIKSEMLDEPTVPAAEDDALLGQRSMAQMGISLVLCRMYSRHCSSRVALANQAA